MGGGWLSKNPIAHDCSDRTCTLTRRAILLAQTRSPTSPGLRLRTRSAGANRERPSRDLLLQVTRRVRVQAVISIPSARDCPSVPVTGVILEATGDPHPDPLPGQGEGIEIHLAHLYLHGLRAPKAFIDSLFSCGRGLLLPSSTFSCGRGQGEGSGTLQATPPTLTAGPS